MLPTTMILPRLVSLQSTALIAALSLSGLVASNAPALALSPLGSAALAFQGKTANTDVIEIRAVARRGGVGGTAWQRRGLSEQDGGAGPCGSAGISRRRRSMGTACHI